jgi:cobalt-zinc-cadmium efflux system membrane fusion protein
MTHLFKIEYILITLFSSFILVACNSSTKEEALVEDHHEEELNTVELTEAQLTTAGIELGKIERKQISGTVKVNGLLDVPPQ